MRFDWHRRTLIISAVLTLALAAFVGTASAQQITYYDFNAPEANSGQVSYQCSPTGNTNPLFCFNDGTGQNANPSFLLDTYPAIVDPNQMDSPPVSSANYAIQLTPAVAEQASSMWFSVPQKVAGGFTSYFAFKITPPPAPKITGDGIAFVIQNSIGGTRTSLCDPVTGPSGSGPTAIGENGGCIGYGGMDNNLALEFDTYRNSWDPDDNGTSLDDNHIALQNCGAGQPNSPDHTGPCLVTFSVNGVSVPAIVNPGIKLADGTVHQVVVSYSGPTEAVPNLLQIYIDPPFVPGTHTPTAAAVPVLSGVYNIAANLNLINSGTANDSAYVGFTSATGGDYEQHELLAWTYTAHTTTTVQQPISPPGQPTVFPFGSHVVGITYPPGIPTGGITMTVTANTITPLFFSQLINVTPFAGTQCQVYDETGGSCVVYSVSCSITATGAPTQCPAGSASNPILIKTAFDNTVTPTSPGFLQGDPFYTLLSSISGNGSVATVTCTGECSVTTGQTITIGNSSDSGFNGTYTVLSANPAVPNVFTFASSDSETASGGYITSSNLQNIFTSYVTQRLDGTVSGKTKNFSDFVATAVTPPQTTTTTTLTSNPTSPTEGKAAVLSALVTGIGQPGGTVVFSSGTSTLCTSSVGTNGIATCNYTPTTVGPVPVTATYGGDTADLGSSNSITLIVVSGVDTRITFKFYDTHLVYPGKATVGICVARAASATPTGSVTLYDGSTLLTTVQLQNGCATTPITGLTAGTHNLTAKYSGDANNPSGTSAPTPLVITPAPLSLSVLCSPSPIPSGNSFSCAVALNSPAEPLPGYITYSLDGGAPVQVSPLYGFAVFTISNPSVGTHQLVISYAPQANYANVPVRVVVFTVTSAPTS